ncbi:MAG: transglycosylase SLT domain-containing protein [Burkholderia gladioli]
MNYYDVEQYRPASIECVLQSAVRYHVPADVLLAIGQHEAGDEGSAIRNGNGTFDLGRAGINTVHVEELTRYGVPAATAVHYLRFDGCYNYAMAAYLLRRQLAGCDQSYWTCVANYHSRTPRFNAIYQQKIIPLARQWASYLREHYRVKGFER